MGYTPPPFDGTVGGGANQYDVYLHKYSGAYGVTFSDGSVTSYGTPPRTAYKSYIFVDPTYDGFGYADRLEPLKVTAAHEYFHAIQFAYSISAGGWFMEISSTWMEDILYDDINDYRLYLPHFFNYPQYGLDKENGAHEYAACIFGHYISENFTNFRMRRIWDNTVNAGAGSAMSAIENALLEIGTNRSDVFSDFTVWNYLTGARANGTHLTYSEGMYFPSINIAATYSAYPVSEKSSKLEYLSTYYYHFNPIVAPTNLTLSFSQIQSSSWKGKVVVDSSGVYKSYNIDLSSGSGTGKVLSFHNKTRAVFIPARVASSGNDLSYNYGATLQNLPTVIAPNGGEILTTGSVYNITWTSSGISNVKIEYSTNAGINWITITPSAPASPASYSWSVANAPTTQGLVKISSTADVDIFDISNNLFSIKPVKDIDILSVTLTSIDSPYFVVNRAMTVSALIRNNGTETNPGSVLLTYKAGSVPGTSGDGTNQVFTPVWSGSPATATITFSSQYSHSTPGIFSMFVKAFHTGDQNSSNDINSKSENILEETRINLSADGGGYMWSASNHGSKPRPAYEWIQSGSGVGSFITNSNQDEFLSSSIGLPMPFIFYGIVATSVKISTNGWITFDVSQTEPFPNELVFPNSSNPNYMIAPLWDNLTPNVAEQSSGIYYRYIDNKFVIQWDNFKSVDVPGSDITMQIVLNFVDNTITFSYASITDGGFIYNPSTESSQGSVGIEGNGIGSDGSNYYFKNDKPLNKPGSGVTVSLGTNVEALPIILASFTAEINYDGPHVTLNWVTLSELNNYGFYIEKFNNQTIAFEIIENSFQPGSGYSIEPRYYSWTDQNVSASFIQYRLRQVDNDGLIHFYGPITVNLEPTNIRTSASKAMTFELCQNFPNPFNPVTVIKFQLPVKTRVTLKVYDILGREIITLVNDYLESGYYQESFNSSTEHFVLPSGVYYYKLTADGFTDIKKMFLMK